MLLIKMFCPLLGLLYFFGVSKCMEWDAADGNTLAQFSVTMNNILERLGSVETETADLRNENRWLKKLVMKTALQSKVQSKEVKLLKEEIVQIKDRVRNSEIISSKKSHIRKDDIPKQNQNITVTPDPSNVRVNKNTEDAKVEKIHRTEINKEAKGTNNSKIRRLLAPLSTTPTAPTRTAFSARAVKDVTGLGHIHPIIFDHVDVNLGHNYDPSLGIFTCPVQGYYFFTSSLTSIPGQEANADIVLNGKRLGSLFAGDDIGSDAHHGYETASTSVITHCMPGDHVWMKLYSVGDRIHGNLHSGFEGFLIWSDSE